jgi:hypothetical protein
MFVRSGEEVTLGEEHKLQASETKCWRKYLYVPTGEEGRGVLHYEEIPYVPSAH